MESVRGVTATAGSNPALSASEADYFLSGRACVANDAHFTGSFTRRTTIMRRTNRLSIRPRGISARFLRATIVEWLFPMHIDKSPAHLQRAQLLQTETTHSHVA